MSAVEIARLANMALADIGHPAVVEPTPGLPDTYGSVAWQVEDSATIRRAVYLATLKVDGPRARVACPLHCYSLADCGDVAVVDALMGRTCDL